MSVAQNYKNHTRIAPAPFYIAWLLSFLILCASLVMLFVQKEQQLVFYFLASLGQAPLIMIDEAQKAPALFDTIKLMVDEDRRPGRFLLLGSTEFSLLQNIQESLTGRMGKIRLFPMTFQETRNLPAKTKKPSRADTLKYLESGGMPGIAFVRDAQVRAEFFQDWIDLTCQRDIHQFKRLKLDSDLAYSLLKHASNLEEPTAAAFARITRANHKKIATHLKALCELYVLVRLEPHPSGTGKAVYLPMDSGIAAHLGAPIIKRLQIALMNERMAANSHSGGKRNTYYYYRSSGKKTVHLIEEELGGKTRAFQFFERETVRKIDLELLKAFAKKNKGAEVHLLAPVADAWRDAPVMISPWESMFDAEPRGASVTRG
ncbi:MAG: ATP-binding protein [Proteobacteria bacterium]|nr:ATP-binding protein [Pseudomonadota bacterium]